MNKFQLLVAFLKVCNQNLNMLHRDIVSKNFFEDHEKLQEYYEKFQGWADELAEVGRTLGYEEPSMSESINIYSKQLPILKSEKRDAKTTFTIVREYFLDLIRILESTKPEVKDFVANRLEEIQYYANLEANYKLNHLLAGFKIGE